MNMKFRVKQLSGAMIASLLLSGPADADAQTVCSQLVGTATIVNHTSAAIRRQTLGMQLNGQWSYEGQLGRISVQVNSRPGTRRSGVNTPLTGAYPVRVTGRINGDINYSFAFASTARVGQQSISIPGYGSVALNRRLQLRKPGRQSFSVRGRVCVPVPE